MINQKIQLTDDGKNLFPNPNLVGIDTSNVIASYGNSFVSYTATQDCCAWIYLNQNNNYIDVFLDGKQIACVGGTANSYSMTTIPLKKGQTLTKTSVTKVREVIIYGLKYI